MKVREIEDIRTGIEVDVRRLEEMFKKDVKNWDREIERGEGEME